MADYGLDPLFASRLEAFRTLLRDKYGLDTSIGSGLRDNDTQARLYAQGRTAPGPIVTNAPPGSSYHNYGAAADLAPQGMPQKDAEGVMRRAFQENPDTGLTWGGSFKSIYDPFHVQMGTSLAQLRSGGAPQMAANQSSGAGQPSISPASAAAPVASGGAPAASPPSSPGAGMLAGANLTSGQQGGPDYGMLAQKALALMQPPKFIAEPPPLQIQYPIPAALRARMASAALGQPQG